MEVSFYLKSQSLIPSSPCSLSNYSLNPASIRREFSFCRTKSRPYGLRSDSWSKCDNLRLRFRTRIPRCLLRDSVIESYIAALAAVASAVAALRLVYLYYIDAKRHHACPAEALDENTCCQETVSDMKISENFEKILSSQIDVSTEEKITYFSLHIEDKSREIEKDLFVRNGEQEQEIGSISKGFISKKALEFAVSNAEGSSTPTGYSKGRTTVACLKEGTTSKVKRLDRPSELKNIGGRNVSSRNINGKITKLPKQIQFLKGGNDPSNYLNTYNCLMRDGRLRDCVDLLEDMEREGLLDMDKVHHASFFNACKRRKAVDEAIRFGKLIKNPKMSTFNMLLSVCASSQDFDGAYQVMVLIKEAGLKPDCKLYTTLISAFAKSGKVDAMFEVFHEMVNANIEPNVNTYGALIDGCARSGQVAKAFGAYGIMQSKKVQPDRVVFNALITACGESGAVDRAFDVLSEMMAEPKPVLPDHVTVGALIKTCTKAGQVDRAHEVYKMLEEYNITGTVEVYTIAVRSCSLTGDLDFALKIYNDMKFKGVMPDEMFLSTLIDVAGHAGAIDTAFKILNGVRENGIKIGNISYNSLMGACCNAKEWEKALELYEEFKSRKMIPTVSMLNALITALCDSDQFTKSMEIFEEMKKLGVQPNEITYSILIIACQKKDEAEIGLALFEQAKSAGTEITSIMCACLTGLCLQRFEKDCSLGNTTINFYSGKPQISNKWTSRALMVYHETVSSGSIPKITALSQVLACLKFPSDNLIKNRLIENLGFGFDSSNGPNLISLLDGFGEYDTRAFPILEEGVSLGLIPKLTFKEKPVIVDARKLQIHTAEVYLLATLKGLKNRLAAGAKLPSITILLPTEETQIEFLGGGERTINLATRVGQAIGSLLRRLGIHYQGDESHGKLRISGLALKRWFDLNLKAGNDSASISGKTFPEMIPFSARLAKGIADQQRSIRSRINLSPDY